MYGDIKIFNILQLRKILYMIWYFDLKKKIIIFAKDYKE